ncbi:MAG: magnesium chelatase subunit D [Pseudomonadota bacterium]
MSPGQAAWARACLALDLLCADPSRCRGMIVRARSSPVRDVFLEILNRKLGPVRRLHPTMTREALLGGVDFAQTLATGKMTKSTGVLDQNRPCVLTMAERCPADTAALIARKLDTDPSFVLVVLDEGIDADEAAPVSLSERLAFSVSLDGIGRMEATPHSSTDTQPVQSAAVGRKTPQSLRALTALAARLGIDSLRPPKFAWSVAQLIAASAGRDTPNEDDARQAAELVLAPRARHLPEQEPDQQDPQPEAQDTKRPRSPESQPDDMLVDAVRAVLPPDLLENINNSDVSRSKGSGAGQRTRGNRRGRPLPSRPGRLDGTSRLDLVATLRAAVPWQGLRGKSKAGPIRVYPSDIHVKRYEDKSDRLIVFAVDASGSAALARLGEAKGAVELLLARAYATRDHVALVAFRGDDAQILLPPTRSLVQTKRRLADLPGGGGTPLANGLKTAAELAQHGRSQGLSPLVAILTDGRANIALDGSVDRTRAKEDAKGIARWMRHAGVPSIVLDLGMRPHPALAALACEMGANYTPLPRGTAERMSETLNAAMDHGLGT